MSNVTKCPDCGGTVSRRAQTCPHCGAPGGAARTQQTTLAQSRGLPSKPAGVVMQILGILAMLVGGGMLTKNNDGGILVIGLGIVFVVWGGMAHRKRR